MSDELFSAKTFNDRLLTATHSAENIEIEEKTGINNKTLSGYRNGRARPNVDTLLKISRAYNCSIDYLLGNDITVSPEPTSRQICESLMRIDETIDLHICPQDNSVHFSVYLDDEYTPFKDGDSDAQQRDAQRADVMRFFKDYSKLKSSAADAGIDGELWGQIIETLLNRMSKKEV